MSERCRHSYEGLTLETSAFQIVHGGNSTFIDTFDQTKFYIKMTIALLDDPHEKAVFSI